MPITISLCYLPFYHVLPDEVTLTLTLSLEGRGTGGAISVEHMDLNVVGSDFSTNTVSARTTY